MKMSEIRKMGPKERDKKLEELRKELIVVNTKKSSGANPDNPGKVREIRKSIARILTEKNRRNEEQI